MVPELAVQLARVEKGLRDLGRSRPRFAPGLAPARTSAVLTALGLPDSEDLATLYAWHDGVDEPPETVLGDLYLLPGYFMPSLADAAAMYRDLQQARHWNPAWFPFLADGGGYFYAADLDEGGEVHRYRYDEWDQPVEYRSLTAMFSTIATAFERGAYVIDPNGHLEPIEEQFALIAAEINPDVPWWTE